VLLAVTSEELPRTVAAAAGDSDMLAELEGSPQNSPRASPPILYSADYQKKNTYIYLQIRKK